MNGGQEKPKEDREGSPTESQQTVSDDDEIDYSIKPEFYDPNLDDKDELWVQKKRKGHTSDAVLSCPACFTTLCLDCQRSNSDKNNRCPATPWAIEWNYQSFLLVLLSRRGSMFFTALLCPLTEEFSLWPFRHEKYLTQYRAVFVINCKIKSYQVSQPGSKRKRGRRHRTSSETEADYVAGEAVKPVCCSVCSTDVGVIDEEEVYHFFNVLPSES